MINKEKLILDFLEIQEIKRKVNKNIAFSNLLKQYNNKKECLKILLKYTTEDLLKYNEKTIENLTLEELEEYGFDYVFTHNTHINTFLNKKILIYDVINFIYNDYYNEEEIIKLIYKKTLKTNKAKDLYELLTTHKKAPLYFHYCLEVLLKKEGIENIEENDELIKNLLTIDYLKQHNLYQFIKYLYSSHKEMLKKQFNIQ